MIQVDSKFPRWEDDILVSSLTGRLLYRLRMQNDRVVFAEQIYIGERVRDLVQMPDGTFVLWTDDRSFIDLSAIAESGQDGQGADIIGTCGTCHSFTPGIVNPAGPNLWGVYGREIGSTDYEGYSDALRSATGVWDEAKLRSFLLDPQSVVPGTTMPAPPSPDTETLGTLIAVLRALH